MPSSLAPLRVDDLARILQAPKDSLIAHNIGSWFDSTGRLSSRFVGLEANRERPGG